MIVLAPISVGELLDKITILQIKQMAIDDRSKLANVNKELGELLSIFDNLTIPDVSELTTQLKQVNTELWDIEDNKRAHEHQQLFDNDFVQLARQVYIKNDLRAGIKRKINQLCGSDIVEEKSYK
jgi:hypothetical protein